MKEFLFIFRAAAETAGQQPSPEQMQATMKHWQDWMGGIAAQDKLVSVGNRLSPEGSVVKPGSLVTNGPYVEIKEAVGGYTMIRAASLSEATEIAKGCPILAVNGTVEVRPIAAME